jgi:hypothetical protein
MMYVGQASRRKQDTTQYIKVQEKHNGVNPRINDRFIFDYRMESSQDLYTITDPKTAGYS